MENNITDPANQDKKTLPKSLTTVTTLSKTLALILFIALPFIGFALGMKYEDAKNITNISEDNMSSSTMSKPSPKLVVEKNIVDNEIFDLWPISYQQLSYKDDYCGLSFKFPQRTRNFLWIVDASKDRTFISYEGRESPDKELDHSVVVFAQDLLSKHHFYSSSITIVCADNKEGLSLEDLKDRYIAYDNGGEVQMKVLPKVNIGGVSMYPVETSSQFSDPNTIYLGVNGTKLVTISNDNKTQGELQDDTGKILESITFK